MPFTKLFAILASYSLIVLSTGACLPVKSESQYTKSVSIEDQSYVPNRSTLPSLTVRPTVFLSQWMLCEASEGAQGVTAKAKRTDIYLVDDKNVVIAEKLMPDIACNIDYTDAELLAQFKTANNKKPSKDEEDFFRRKMTLGDLVRGTYQKSKGGVASKIAWQDKTNVSKSFAVKSDSKSLTLVAAKCPDDAYGEGETVSCSDQVYSKVETSSSPALPITSP